MSRSGYNPVQKSSSRIVPSNRHWVLPNRVLIKPEGKTCLPSPLQRGRKHELSPLRWNAVELRELSSVRRTYCRSSVSNLKASTDSMSASARSLGKGSAPPGPVPKGVIRHYSMRYCPYAQRTRLVLIAKCIKYEDVNINLKNKPDWFFEKNPLGLVPVIETSDGKIIYESAVVCEYLDEVFPGVKLTPSDPYEKAKQKMFLEQFSAAAAVFYKIQNLMQEATDEMWAQFFEKLNKIDEVLAKKNTPYFGGNSVAMIDYMIWPWFERFMTFGAADMLEKTAHLKVWQNLMMQDPAVKATYTKPEVLKAFFKDYAANSLDACDYGLE